MNLNLKLINLLVSSSLFTSAPLVGGVAVQTDQDFYGQSPPIYPSREFDLGMDVERVKLSFSGSSRSETELTFNLLRYASPWQRHPCLGPCLCCRPSPGGPDDARRAGQHHAWLPEPAQCVPRQHGQRTAPGVAGYVSSGCGQRSARCRPGEFIPQRHPCRGQLGQGLGVSERIAYG